MTETALALRQTDTEIITALQNSLYLGAATASVKMVLSYCAAAGLDPMTKPVHIVPMSVKDPISKEYVWRDVVMPGIELYRTKAARTKEYAGCTEPEFGPDITKVFKGKGGKAGAELTFPAWCKMTIRRLLGDRIVEFTAKEIWLENYASESRDSESPNTMWKKRPYAQLAKCVEAQCLRKAFPESGGAQTAEEMDGKTIEVIEAQPASTGVKNPEILKALIDEALSFNDPVNLKAWRSNNAAQISDDLSGQGELFAFNAKYAEHLAELEKAAKKAEVKVKPMAEYDAEILAISSADELNKYWQKVATNDKLEGERLAQFKESWVARKKAILEADSQPPATETVPPAESEAPMSDEKKKMLAAASFVGESIVKQAMKACGLEDVVALASLPDHLCKMMVLEMNAIVDRGGA